MPYPLFALLAGAAFAAQDAADSLCGKTAAHQETALPCPLMGIAGARLSRKLLFPDLARPGQFIFTTSQRSVDQLIGNALCSQFEGQPRVAKAGSPRANSGFDIARIR